MDETASGYGLLAEDVAVAPDRLSVTFRLRPEARFHDGIAGASRRREAFSFDTLIGHASPRRGFKHHVCRR